MVMTVPAAAFRNGDTYPIKLNITNSDMTYDRLLTVNFIPISCHYYIVKGSDASSAFNDYLFDTGVNDINFTLSYYSSSPYCLNSTFFNQFVPSITYQLSHPVQMMP